MRDERCGSSLPPAPQGLWWRKGGGMRELCATKRSGTPHTVLFAFRVEMLRGSAIRSAEEDMTKNESQTMRASARTPLPVVVASAALVLGVTACGDDDARHTTSGSSAVLSTPGPVASRSGAIVDCVADAVWRGRHYPAVGLMQREPTYGGPVGRAVIPACGHTDPERPFVAWAIEGVNPRDAIVRRSQLSDLYCRSKAVCRRVVARLRLGR